MNNIYLDILKEICNNKNIKFKVMGNGYILQLIKNNKIRYIMGNSFDIGKYASSRIINDKSATYEILNDMGIPVIEHEFMYKKDFDLNRIRCYFNNHSRKVVIKDNNGSGGKSVYLVDSYDSAIKWALDLYKHNSDISLCPYYDIKNEYRVFYLDGECIFCYGKEREYVLGDGKRKVRELIDSKNYDNINISLDYVPKKNEKVYLSWKNNLSLGANPFYVTDKKLEIKIKNLAKRAGMILNLGFVTIDIVLTKDNKLYILEINAGVCMNEFIKKMKNGREIAYNIYSKAIDKMFL